MKFAPARCFLWALLRPKCVGRDSAPDPAGGAYSSGPSLKPPLPLDLSPSGRAFLLFLFYETTTAQNESIFLSYKIQDGESRQFTGGGALALINVVNRQWARLLLGWVTSTGSKTARVYNQLSISRLSLLPSPGWVTMSNNDGDGGCCFIVAYRRANGSSPWAWSNGRQLSGAVCIHCVNHAYDALVVTSWTCYGAL